MGTRANVVIRAGATEIYFHRIYDGYPAETGADLAEMLFASEGSAHKLIEQMIAKRYDKDNTAVFEVTSGIHSDADWIYIINFGDDLEYGKSEASVGWMHQRYLPGGADTLVSKSSDRLLKRHLQVRNGLHELIEYVNQDRVAINLHRSKFPTPRWVPFELVEFPPDKQTAAADF
jgi:hypothetical protein